MMKTRRQSKAAAAAETDAEKESSQVVVRLPDDIDEGVLSDILPDLDLFSVSSEEVVALYRLIITQNINLNAVEREKDETKAELERKDVELDQALQDRESSTQDLESSIESIQKELDQVKQERTQLAEDKAALQAELGKLSSFQSSSSTEVETLKRRVDDTEREKRDLVGVISRLKDESSQRDEEIHTLRANLKEARQEHQALETQVRELRSNETATKFRIESLSQQLQLTQTEAERSNAELISKTDEFAKYRRVKHAEFATLQASFDSLTQTHTAMETSFKALQASNTAQAHQLTQALSKVQALTEQLAEQEARYSNEASGLKRLVTLMEEREKQAKEIVENVEREWATVGEKAERREEILKEETARERRAREVVEKRLEQLEAVLDRIGRGELPVPAGSAPSTPFKTPGGGDILSESIMNLSPTVAMASRSQRSGKTFTEIYTDYVRLQEAHTKLQVEYDNMDRTLSSVLAQIEERAPILSQQRVEYQRLQIESSQLSAQLAQALAGRDTQTNFANEQTQKLSKLTHENDMLQKQLEDLGRQVQHLLRQVARRDDPSIPPDDELDGVEPATDTQMLISNHLVLFKSIDGVQQQNQRLLKIVRELADKLETEERDYKENMEKEQAEAIREAHEAMQELAAELERQKKSSDSRIQAYVKEREMLKSMLARSEKAIPQGGPGSKGDNIDPNDESGLAQMLAETQSQFEAYKAETDVDSNRLRDELVAAQKELNQMGAALAKANAKVDYLTDRHRMHEEQFRRHNLDIDELSKRNAHLHEQNVRFDIECGKLSDELQVALSRVEQLRNECANLRAEKKIWESVQTRLVEENRSLSMERSHLSDLMSNVQKMHNDLERSGENDRRRLESQLQMLESQTQDLRSQLISERDAVRHLGLQKDLELKELQTRLDKQAQEFSKTRESLVEAQTSKKHLEEKVDDLNRQLKGITEKLAVYERRPAVTNTTISSDHDSSQEQQLESEVAELRATLKVTEVDLAAARSHRDQYQEISQASETALASLNSTFDDYKASSEAQITRHESEIKSLREKLDQSNKELADIRTEYNNVQKSFEAERTAWINDKKILEDTIVDLSSSEKLSESDRDSREQELRTLEVRAKTAEERYSHELLSHAESMKSIENLKKEVSSLQANARQHLSASETAQAKLVSSENSWKQQKESLDTEVASLNDRVKDLTEQNSLLHQHLESVSAQATKIRQAADAPVDIVNEGGEYSVVDADNRLAELRSVVNYLRKEKGIVDLQLEMSKRDNEILKSQIDRLSQTLQETRNTLTEERERAIQNTASAAQHAELVERINQFNILRESNATLRTECESSSKKARELENKLKQLSQELEPAKEQARSAQAELEAARVQMQRLEQESRRWQERNTQLLSKYDRIDPSEVQALKDEIIQLKNESSIAAEKLKQKEEEAVQQTKRIDALEQSVRAHKETFGKNTQAFKAKLGELNTLKSNLTQEKQELEAKVSSLEQQIVTLQAGTTTSSNAQTEEQKQLENLRAERDKLLAEKDSWSKVPPASTGATDTLSNWESEKEQLIKARDDALQKLQNAIKDSRNLTMEVRNIKFQNEKFQSKIQDLMKAKAADAEKQAALADAVEKAKAGASNAGDGTNQEDLGKQHAEDLKALETKLKAQHEEDVKARIDVAVREAIQSQSAPAAAPVLADQQAIIDAAVEEFKKTVEERHAAEIASAVDRGRMEAATKAKLKDSQLIKAQKRVKELEAQIHEWTSAGIVLPPATAATTSTAALTSASTSAATPAASTTAAIPSGPKAAVPVPPQASGTVPSPTTSTQQKPVPTANNSTANLPRKPSIAGAPSGPAAGLGRGGPGGPPTRLLGRGGVPLGAGRGNAPLRTAPVRTAPTGLAQAPPLSGGVSIMGAAKRPREDGGAPVADDSSLAKRLKPTEPQARPPVRQQAGPK